MSLKTALLKKQLEKTAGPMELFVAQQLYGVLEKLVVATHEDSAEKIKSLTRELAQKMSDYCVEIKENIEKQSDDAVAKVKKSGKDAQVDTNTVVAEIRAQSSADIAALLVKFKTISDSIIREIEKKVGPQGIPGKPGEKGSDGSPDTPKQVVAKVNEVGGVKIASVDGLEEQLKAAKKGGGGGKSGGGVGNAQHETKPVSSGTTSITTSYPVAAGGRAIWMYYQGQFLVYGTHYTVSGRTITLTFDKVDSTFIDLTYIRA